MSVGNLATTPFEYLQRTVDIYLHGGLYMNGVKICGDYMFSGRIICMLETLQVNIGCVVTMY